MSAKGYAQEYSLTMFLLTAHPAHDAWDCLGVDTDLPMREGIVAGPHPFRVWSSDGKGLGETWPMHHGGNHVHRHHASRRLIRHTGLDLRPFDTARDPVALPFATGLHYPSHI